MLYLHHEDRPFYTMVVDDIYLSGGCFVKATQLAIYTAEGDIWLYLLPKKLLELAAEHRRNPGVLKVPEFSKTRSHGLSNLT